MRYIDADDTKKLIDCCADLGGILGEIIDHVKSYAKLMVEATPTADVVEIIRCKDCKHFECDHPYIIQGIPVLGHEVCNAWGGGCKTDENGYCFMAERKGGENE